MMLTPFRGRAQMHSAGPPLTESGFVGLLGRKVEFSLAQELLLLSGHCALPQDK
jgi:hypothetical protein